MKRSYVAALSVALAAIAHAGPESYATRVQTIRAGVVVLDGAKLSSSLEAASAAPFAFYNLDRQTSVKPAGWSFVNPLAPSVVTPRIRERWGILGGAAAAPRLNDRITRRNAPYWEVPLSQISDLQLSNYDMLLVAPKDYLSVNPGEREKLRRFVDQGGLLWVDASGLPPTNAPQYNVDELNNLPVPFGLRRFGGRGLDDTNDFSHPLLAIPNALTERDMAFLNSDEGRRFGLWQVDLSRSDLRALEPLVAPLEEDFFKLKAVSLDTNGNSTLGTIAVSRIGDGFMVVTTRSVARKLNNPRGRDNTGYFAIEDALSADGFSAAKLVVNMANLASDYRQAGGGTRKANRSTIDVSAPLLRRFAAPMSLSNNPNASQPVIWQGMVFISSGSRLLCYDVNPSQDLDGDGDPDDGVRDLSTGQGVDLVWQSVDGGSTFSTPALAEVPEAVRVRGAQKVPRNQAVVTTLDGRLLIFDATVPGAGEAVPDRTFVAVNPPSNPTGSATVPNPPTIHEGLAFISDTPAGTGSTSGRIWIADLHRGQPLTSGSAQWHVGGSGSSGNPLQLPNFSAGPTVAYVPTADNSGALDRVLYVPFAASADPGQSTTPGFVSLWVGARSEKPTNYDIDGTDLLVDTRAEGAGNLPIYAPTTQNERLAQGSLGVKLTLLKKVNGVATGDPMPAAEMATILTGAFEEDGGQLKFALKGGINKAAFDARVAGIRVDYTIDWGRAMTTGTWAAIERGRVNLPTARVQRQILGNLAVSGKGTVFCVIGDPSENNAGSLFGFREDAGRGAFRCILRYDLFGPIALLPNQGTQINYAPNFRDQDELIKAFTGANGPLSGDYVRNMKFRSGPSILGNQLFVVASGKKGPEQSFAQADVSVVMAFSADPETPAISVGNIGETFSISQPDLLRSTNRTRPEALSTLQPGNFKYDKDAGVVRIENLMNINRGQIQNCISLSMPVYIRRPGGGDTLVEPELAGGKWSPLLWYTVLHSVDVTTAPVATGNTLYVAGRTLLPSFIEFGVGATISNLADSYRGALQAIRSEISGTDRFLKADPGRAWIRQLLTLLPGPSSAVPLDGNPNFLWPYYANITDASGFLTAIKQPLFGESRTAHGMVAGERSVVGWGDFGIYTFAKADVVVCDEGRIGRFDASGNPLWITDSTFVSGSTGESSVGQARPIVKATRAYPIGASDLLIVDTGGNRIARINGSAVESRSIEGFQLDPVYRPEGFLANETLALNAPRDVLTWREYVTRPASPLVSNQQDREYWVNWMIADSGNGRIIWLIDRYLVDDRGRIGAAVQANGIAQVGVLYWHSPANLSGRGFAYSGLARVFVPASAGRESRFVYIASIGGGTPSRASLGLDAPVGGVSSVADGNGGIVVFDARYPNASQVFNGIQLPDLRSTPFWNESANIWNAQTALNQNTRVKPIGSIASLSARAEIVNPGDPATVYLMFTDASGIYEAAIVPGASPDQDKLSVNWMLPAEAYKTLRRSGAGAVPDASNPGLFLPTFARRLDNGEILLVNGYYGSTRGVKELATGNFNGKSAFGGEILQLDGTLYNVASPNLGFLSSQAIKYQLTRITGAREITLPTFADRR